jgi:hypothetical protein
MKKTKEKNKQVKKFTFFSLFFQLQRNSTTYKKQWERLIPRHGISNAMDHQFTTWKVMAMRVIPPKTHGTRVATNNAREQQQ